MHKKLLCPKCGSDQLTALKTKTQAGAQRYQCRDCKERTCFPSSKPPEPKVEFSTTVKPSKRYVVTWAQNATPAHKPLLRSLLVYCKENDAQLIVIPGRYKNPTSVFTDGDFEWWDKSVLEYLYAGRSDLNDNVMLLGDIKIQPTAERPLQGFESLTGAKSGIFGHPKVALTSVATPQNELPKLLWTTGAVTVENYTDSKAGKKGEFHHSFGAIVVEIEDASAFYVRQLNAQRNGNFMDIAGGRLLLYTPKGVKKAPRAAGLVMGDTHRDYIDPGVEKATFDSGGLVDVARPRNLVWHDLTDSYAISHHHRHNPFTQLAKRESKRNIARNEMERAFAFVAERTPPGTKSLIVASNHLDHLTRWIMESDWKMDLDNAQFYLETALAMVKGTVMTPHGASFPDPVTYWGERALKGKRFLFLGRDQSHAIKGIEVGFHSDKGANGSKGSIAQFSKIGAKTVIGDRHAPGILDGSYQVGTNSYLKLEYTNGLSSWMHTDCLIYANGKRSLINFINGKYRL